MPIPFPSYARRLAAFAGLLGFAFAPGKLSTIL
jgi:hypothetical protein